MGDPAEKTLWCGNLSPNVTEDLLFELFLQAGPLEKVTLPKEKDGTIRCYAFIMFKHSVSVAYATDLFNGINLHGRPLRLKPRSISTDSPLRSPNSTQNCDTGIDSHDQRGNKRQIESRNCTRPERIHRQNNFLVSESPNSNSYPNSPLPHHRSRQVEIWQNQSIPSPPGDPRDCIRQNNMQRLIFSQKMMMHGNAYHPYTPPVRNYPYWQ